MRDIVVFDTNILFSAIGWRGKAFVCVEMARNGHIEAATCREILEELAEKLASKLGFDSRQVQETLVDLLTFMRLVTITGTTKVIEADPDDDKILECAVVASATHIVSGDRRHVLPLRKHSGIEILSAGDYLAGKNQTEKQM